MFYPIAKLVIPIETPTKEAKAEMETHPIIVKTNTIKCSIQFRLVQTFFCFLLINSFRFTSSIK